MNGMDKVMKLLSVDTVYPQTGCTLDCSDKWLALSVGSNSRLNLAVIRLFVHSTIGLGATIGQKNKYMDAEMCLHQHMVTSFLCFIFSAIVFRKAKQKLEEFTSTLKFLVGWFCWSVCFHVCVMCCIYFDCYSWQYATSCQICWFYSSREWLFLWNTPVGSNDGSDDSDDSMIPQSLIEFYP